MHPAGRSGDRGFEKVSPDKLGACVQLVGPTALTYASSRLTMRRSGGGALLTSASRASVRAAIYLPSVTTHGTVARRAHGAAGAAELTAEPRLGVDRRGTLS